MALHKNALILIIHNVSIYSIKLCINSNVKVLTVKVLTAKVAETLVETCFCQDGLNGFKPRFKPVLAETCQP